MDACLRMDQEGEAGLPADFMVPDRIVNTEERLPFTVRAVTDEDRLRKAVSIRHHAYERHVPGLAELLRLPEPKDQEAGCVVLLAESKLDGEPLGTMRIQTNRYRPLALEGSVSLPGWLAGRRLAEATRLGIAQGHVGRVVKTILFKAFYLYCLETGIDWMVIGARSPLDKMYRALLFSDLFPGGAPVPLQHAGNIPHRILGFEIETADERWRAARHPLYELFVNTRHPDIDIGEVEALARVPAELPREPVALAA